MTLTPPRARRHDEVLILAALLKLAEKTVYPIAHAGETSAFKIPKHWRIERTELDRCGGAEPGIGDGGRGSDGD